MNAKLFSVFKINKTIFRYLSWLDLNMILMVVVICQELRNMMEYQVSIQTSLVREMDCLKDQLDLLREQWHNMSDTSLGEGAGLGAGQLLPSLRSEACLVTATVSSHSQSNLLEHSYTVSHNNLATASKVDICNSMSIFDSVIFSERIRC